MFWTGWAFFGVKGGGKGESKFGARRDLGSLISVSSAAWVGWKAGRVEWGGDGGCVGVCVG